ncbi:hypothetical protein GCM10009101_28970 [Brevundimonas lenta]
MSLILAGLGAAAAMGPADTPGPSNGACEQRLHQAALAQGVAVRPGERVVSDREGRLRRDLTPGEVRLYYLVDRRIDGCPVPVASSAPLPEANRAVGRNLATGR